jgi:hypothetical protein
VDDVIGAVVAVLSQNPVAVLKFGTRRVEFAVVWARAHVPQVVPVLSVPLRQIPGIAYASV